MNTTVTLPTSAKPQLLGYVGRTPGMPIRDSDTWHTPMPYIACARTVMGSIDLDPFSSESANAHINARYYMTPTSSALTHRWRTGHRRRRYPDGLNVWMNPPYSNPLLSQAMAALLNAWNQGDIAQAIVLVNNGTETCWFQQIRKVSHAVCFPTHRIAFLAPDGKTTAGNTRAQVFFYLGHDTGSQRFIEEFSQFGWCIHSTQGWK